MKVYKRNMGLTLLSALISLALMFLLLGIIYYFVPNASSSNVFRYAAVILIVLFLLIFVPSLKEQVMVTERAFILKGFRVKDRSSVESGKKTPFGSQGSDPGKEIAVPFSTVTRIELSRDILFWRCNLRMLADDFYQPVLIGGVMNEHKQLFGKIVEGVKCENPNAFIDPKIEKYLG